jgi:hypothetical protein
VLSLRSGEVEMHWRAHVVPTHCCRAGKQYGAEAVDRTRWQRGGCGQGPCRHGLSLTERQANRRDQDCLQDESLHAGGIARTCRHSASVTRGHREGVHNILCYTGRGRISITSWCGATTIVLPKRWFFQSAVSSPCLCARITGRGTRRRRPGCTHSGSYMPASSPQGMHANRKDSHSTRTGH